jgi:protein-S-isoprenylcysteine O-methyltransferase Ste14
MLKRIAVFGYGVACYAVFFATFLYSIGFIGNLVVPKSMDSATNAPLLKSLVIDLLLLAIFAVQHSVMARPWFKRAWTRLVPEPAERSTYVLFSSVALIALFILWQPLGGTIWNIQSSPGRALMYTGFAFGFALVLLSTFLINHFDLFGLRQVWLYLRGKPYTQLAFRTPALYKHVRHPLYVGWFMSFWFTPAMTVTHLLFAAMCSAYILLAIRWEERDLVSAYGAKYVEYRSNVPMLLPSAKPYQRLTPRETIRRLA